MRISEAFSKMRLSDYCSSQDIDRAIAVTVDSFVASQKVSCKRALARAFAKYGSISPLNLRSTKLTSPEQVHLGQTGLEVGAAGQERCACRPRGDGRGMTARKRGLERGAGAALEAFLMCTRQSWGFLGADCVLL